MPRINPLIEIRRYTDARVIERSNSYRSVGELLEYGVREGHDFTSAALTALHAEHRSFQGARLRSADLSNANLSSTDLQGSDLSDAIFDGAMMDHAELRNSVCSRASFRGAWLVGANFTAADLRNADFSGANLTDANIDYARCSGANFSGACVAGMLIGNATGVDLGRSVTVPRSSAPVHVTPRARTVKAYLAYKKVAVTVERSTTPSANGMGPLWDVQIKAGKRRMSALIEYNSTTKPSRAQAIGALIELAPHVDNGRGDCKCGCGITPASVYFQNTGYESTNPYANMRYGMCVNASKVLRGAFGNDREGYNYLMGMDRYNPENATD